MVITFTTVLLGLLALMPMLQKNKFYLLNCAIIIGSAYYIENNYFTTSIFTYKTFMLLLVFQIISINITTFIAYWADKRAAKNKQWRVSERDLHTLEFLGGWLGAYIAQKTFKHKTSKKSYLKMFKVMIIMEFIAIYIILNFLKLI